MVFFIIIVALNFYCYSVYLRWQIGQYLNCFIRLSSCRNTLDAISQNMSVCAHCTHREKIIHCLPVTPTMAVLMQSSISLSCTVVILPQIQTPDQF